MKGNAQVSSLVADSRKVTGGSLFVMMPSDNTDVASFLWQALSYGATAVLAFDSRGFTTALDLGLAAAQLFDYREELWKICRAFYDSPTASIKTVGVTGTNGKTTTAWLMRDLAQNLGQKAGYLGTLGFQLPSESQILPNTTPFPVELFSMLDEAREADVDFLAMEISSHALEEKRSDGIEFDAAVFTNLSQDHLDFHGTMEAYEASKLRLFTELPLQTQKPFRAAMNVDDPVGARFASWVSVPVLRYGLSEGVDLRCRPLDVTVDTVKLRFDEGSESFETTAPLGGMFNVWNCLSAVAGMRACGFSLEELVGALPKVRPVPGRFESVANEAGIGILVDYAHTPDALEKLLDSVRELKPSRIITVFGCGGDRDSGKRPQMARAASKGSDFTVVTSDNPRTEDPQAILNEVVAGIQPGAEFVSIIDRREAVARAISIASPGDVVVIAGKGHEDYQIIGRTKHHMDDRELAREALST